MFMINTFSEWLAPIKYMFSVEIVWLAEIWCRFDECAWLHFGGFCITEFTIYELLQGIYEILLSQSG